MRLPDWVWWIIGIPAAVIVSYLAWYAWYAWHVMSNL